MDYRYWNAKAALFRALGRVEGVLGGLDPRARTILDRAVSDIDDNLSVLLQYTVVTKDNRIGEVPE